jgi:hypothetical protein
MLSVPLVRRNAAHFTQKRLTLTLAPKTRPDIRRSEPDKGRYEVIGLDGWLQGVG